MGIATFDVDGQTYYKVDGSNGGIVQGVTFADADGDQVDVAFNGGYVAGRSALPAALLRDDALAVTATADQRWVPAKSDAQGRQIVRAGYYELGGGRTLETINFSYATSGAKTLRAAAGVGVKIYVVHFDVVVATADDITLRSAGNDVRGPWPFQDGGGIVLNGTVREPVTWTNANEALILNIATTGIKVAGGVTIFTGA